MPGDLEPADVKEALKEGLQEWLDKQFATLGKWTFGGLAAMALGAIVYALLYKAGWRHG